MSVARVIAIVAAIVALVLAAFDWSGAHPHDLALAVIILAADAIVLAALEPGWWGGRRRV